jgi:hypothetical protein
LLFWQLLDAVLATAPAPAEDTGKERSFTQRCVNDTDAGKPDENAEISSDTRENTETDDEENTPVSTGNSTFCRRVNVFLVNEAWIS